VAPTVDGITLNLNMTVQPGATLRYKNGLTINKTLSLQSNNGSIAQLSAFDSSAQTIGGSGEIVFDGAGFGTIDTWGTTTLGPNLTIRTGSGGGSIDCVSGSLGSIINQGRISAQTPGKSISFPSAASLTNAGQMQAINGGIISTGVANNNGVITIGAGSRFVGNRLTSTTGTIGGAGELQITSDSTIGGTQNWLSGAKLTVIARTTTLSTNSGVPATATSAATANLSLVVTTDFSDGAIVLGSDQDVAGIDVKYSQFGNQSLNLSSPAGAGAFRAVRVYRADLEAAEAAIYSAIINANVAGSPSPKDGIFDSTLAAHANARIGMARLLDAHGDAHLLIRPTRIGDLNLDGTVGVEDFIGLASHFGSSDATWDEGDLNYDRHVTIADFIELASNFGANYSGEAQPISDGDAAMLADFEAAHVPEPGILVLMASVSLLLGRRRRDCTL